MPDYSTAFGLDTDCDADRTFAVGLDGNTNLLSDAGKMKIFGNLAVTGYIGLFPIAAPTLATGENAIYIDSADGDLKVKFANGTVKVIDTN